MNGKWWVVGACVLGAASAARAEVKESAADGFLVTMSATTPAAPAKVYAALAQPQEWWSSEDTWSGNAANLSLKSEAGGCFCERWSEGSAEHGHVIMALPGKLLRLDSTLGPLQEFSLKGILSFWIKTGDDGATQLVVEYRVNGANGSGLDTFAPNVDEVLGEQVARLVRYIDSGNPEAPPKEEPKGQANVDADARAAVLEEWKRSAEAAKAGESGTPDAQKGKAAKAKLAKPTGKDTP